MGSAFATAAKRLPEWPRTLDAGNRSGRVVGDLAAEGAEQVIRGVRVHGTVPVALDRLWLGLEVG